MDLFGPNVLSSTGRAILADDDQNTVCSEEGCEEPQLGDHTVCFEHFALSKVDPYDESHGLDRDDPYDR